MKKKSVSTYEKIGIKDINALEQSLKFPLPEGYKKFLSRNICRFLPNVFISKNGEVQSILDVLYGITKKPLFNLQTQYNGFCAILNRNEWLPIGSDPFGNLIAMNLIHGYIYFWKHDADEEEESFILINEDFNAFLENLFDTTIELTELQYAIQIQNLKYLDRAINEFEGSENSKKEFIRKIVFLAASWDKVTLLKFFKKKGLDLSLALYDAADKGNLKSVEYLISIGSDLNERDFKNNNQTPIITAAAGGYLPVVKALVEAGADINAVDKYNNGALQKSRWSSVEGIDTYLVSKGAKEKG